MRSDIKTIIIILFIFSVLGCDRVVTTTPDDPIPSENKIILSTNPPGYNIYINNKISGKITPDSLLYLEDTDYQISLVSSVYLDSTIVVEVHNDERKLIDIDFTKLDSFYSKLECTSFPSGAEILLNDSATGVYTPSTISGLFPKKYSVSYDKTGYRSKKVDVSLKSNLSLRVNINLEDTTIWLVYNKNNSQLPGNSISSVATDPSVFKGLYVGTSENGIVDLSSMPWINYNSSNSQFKQYAINSIEIIGLNDLLIGSYGGICRLRNGLISYFNTSDISGEVIAVNDIAVISPYKAFVASENNGVLSFDGNKWEAEQSINNKIPGNTVTTLSYFEDRGASYMAAGTRDNGVYIFNTLAGNNIDQIFNMNNSGFISNNITAVAYTPGWFRSYVAVKISSFITDPIGMLYFLNENRVWEEINLDFAAVYCINVHFADVWVGTNKGLFKIENRTQVAGHFTSRNSVLPSDNIYDIKIDYAGNLWLATGNGLVRYKPF